MCNNALIPTYEMNALASRMVVMLDVLNDIGLAVLYVLWQYFVIFVRFKFWWKYRSISKNWK